MRIRGGLCQKLSLLGTGFKIVFLPNQSISNLLLNIYLNRNITYEIHLQFAYENLM